MFKTILLGSCLTLVLGLSTLSSFGQNQEQQASPPAPEQQVPAPAEPQAPPDQPPPDAQAPPDQDNQFEDFPPPAPAPNPEADKYCERPDPNGDPNVGGTDKTRIGCTCERKCDEKGNVTENYADGKRCKVHCKPDHCFCPHPCAKA